MNDVWAHCLKCNVISIVDWSDASTHLCDRCKGLSNRPGGAIGTMGKIRDIVVGLDFESTPTHTVEFDPEAETRTEKGREGDFDVVNVKENGTVYTLSLSNKSLLRELAKVGVVSRLEITRTGKSYDTKYVVKNLGPVRAK